VNNESNITLDTYAARPRGRGLTAPFKVGVRRRDWVTGTTFIRISTVYNEGIT